MAPVEVSTRRPAVRPLNGTRILSLALNLPGPAALMRCQQLGARCTKLEPPGGDPMRHYSAEAYAALHHNIRIKNADLKTEAGQKTLHHQLATADVLLTSFRPSALARLGLSWKALHRLYPHLSQIAIVGGTGLQAEEPGHDLTYLAMAGLVTGTDLPATLYADMAGSLQASQAVLCAVMHTKATGKGTYSEVSLASAADYLALPRSWGLTTPDGAVGGGHAGYQVYACKNGRVAVAALEAHFAGRLCAAAGLADASDMHSNTVHQALRKWLKNQTRAQLDQLAVDRDIPLLTMAGSGALALAH